MMNASSTWKSGQAVNGEYCGQEFSGKLTDDCRPTHDYKNVIFVVDLDNEITVFGQKRQRIEVWTNGSDTINRSVS